MPRMLQITTVDSSRGLDQSDSSRNLDHADSSRGSDHADGAIEADAVGRRSRARYRGKGRRSYRVSAQLSAASGHKYIHTIRR